MTKHDSYCNAAFAHSYIDNNKFTPCCWWQIQDHKPATNIKQMFNSDYMKKVRKATNNEYECADLDLI